MLFLKCCKGRLAPALAATSGVYDISDITQFFNHDKSSSISQLIREKITRSPEF